MDGFEEVQSVRKFEKEHRTVEPSLKEIPIIMTTSSTEDDQYKQALSLGVKDVLVTPIDLEKFTELILGYLM